ncbi:Prefoldin subunit 2 [Micractinium conductrix]|uniref:Prefoldin subunit 2 n=1 Tax=Micractinium conductrix TaxID=554055 RepID=A0A2P6VDG8_9CHLO|nr:Prefoldin subunit 2 [Micractinium conductrix]|eukprot:PSC72135.1 Prefoldin subunit 2 [Micractinium conductrix]
MSGEPTNEQVVARFQQILQERDQLTSAQIDQQAKMAEHDLVIKTLEPLEPGRKCFRLVGDVLVERSVGEVLPAVKSNRDQLSALVTTYAKQLEAKQKEVLEYQEKYNIRIKGDGPEAGGGGGGAGGKAQGVLVGS